MRIDPCNTALLNAANYEDIGSVRYMLALYNSLQKLAEKGDTVAHSIYIDLREAIYSGCLTEKQLEAIELRYLHGTPVMEIAAELNISHQSVRDRLRGAERAIQKMLLSGKLFSKTTCEVGDKLVWSRRG